jgi:DNA-binding XRE family transcriptional regulator
MCLEIRPRHQTCWLGDLKAGFRGIRELCKPIKFVIQDPVIKMERVAVHCSCSRKFSPKNLSASLYYAKRLHLLEDMYETLKNLGAPRSQVFANKSPPPIQPAQSSKISGANMGNINRETTQSKIRQIRESQGMTRRRLAEDVGISENYIYKIENGLKTPTLITLHKIAGALQVKPSVLLDLPLQDLKADMSQLVLRLEEAKTSSSKKNSD